MAQSRRQGQDDRRASVDDDEDLIGTPGETGSDVFEGSFDKREVAGGVSVTWLAHAFHMDPRSVQRRLAECPVKDRKGRGSTPRFELREAARYLLKPIGDMSEYIKKLRPNDLPPLLQTEFWDAALKRQRWQEKAGELWPTERVLDTLAEAFKLIKEKMRSWPDTIEETNGLSNEQRKTLHVLIDGLQDGLHKRLVEFPKQQRTPSQLAEIEDESGSRDTSAV